MTTILISDGHTRLRNRQPSQACFNFGFCSVVYLALSMTVLRKKGNNISDDERGSVGSEWKKV